MNIEREIIKTHFAALLANARANHIPDDVVGRLVLEQVIQLWRAERSLADIASELQFSIDNLDPEIEFSFMRP